MPPTITDEEDPAPSAPPINAVPVVSAIPIASAGMPVAASVAATSLPSSAPKPAGMMAKTVTTTYSDGRQVTTTEYQQPGAAPAASAAPTPSQAYQPPRRDLGSRPVNVTCPYCSHTGKTRVNHNCGDCTWISVIVLLLCCFPFFWIPFICPNCQDVEHHCSNCGKQVGKSRADCCA
mmetsp:Transcript_35021/g.84539  ORF Transcript_35021/g.84539 Transcript_35021/m.84539 type:complete len:177 (-) Transcript_35021:1547-2077(-)